MKNTKTKICKKKNINEIVITANFNNVDHQT